ncbi:MAG: hypothetical protein A2284_08945 [Deltaproteobacteria bacterium RIFOXYA12_FULL_61_11]|nr:MAG: hypothetical protein A2284_08945 [Deltaproteobacteria bacterium RIFOXYA12_FULL_61_11]
MSWWKRAFSLARPQEDAAPEKTERVFLERLAAKVEARGLTTVTVLFLESFRPLAFLGSQLLVFLEPMVKALVNLEEYDHFVHLVERPAHLAYFLRRLERPSPAEDEKNHEQ